MRSSLFALVRCTTVWFALASALTACGGGGGSSAVPATSADPVALSGHKQNASPSPSPAGTTATPQPGASATPSTTSAPSPSPTPSPAPSPSSAAASTGSSCFASNYVNIVNGQEWPLSFCPGASNAPWNLALPSTPHSIDTANTQRLGAYLVNAYRDAYSGSIAQDGDEPTYYASSSDPDVNTNCGGYQWGCNVTFPATIKIPANARPGGQSDHHLNVIQPNGDEYDFWGTSDPGTNWTIGMTIQASTGAKTSVMGSDVPLNFSATSGAGGSAGIIRFNELSNGKIPHALIFNVPCASGTPVYPGTTQAFVCADGNGIPIGAHIYLALSDSQIDALPASTIPSYLRPILHALHQYGAYNNDTGSTGNGTENGAGGTVAFMFESYTQYASFGRSFPGTAFASQHGYVLSNGSYIDPNVINWPALAPYMQVLSGCYALNTCANP